MKMNLIRVLAVNSKVNHHKYAFMRLKMVLMRILNIGHKHMIINADILLVWAASAVVLLILWDCSIDEQYPSPMLDNLCLEGRHHGFAHSESGTT
jgi:hypothetical protein